MKTETVFKLKYFTKNYYTQSWLYLLFMSHNIFFPLHLKDSTSGRMCQKFVVGRYFSAQTRLELVNWPVTNLTGYLEVTNWKLLRIVFCCIVTWIQLVNSGCQQDFPLFENEISWEYFDNFKDLLEAITSGIFQKLPSQIFINVRNSFILRLLKIKLKPNLSCNKFWVTFFMKEKIIMWCCCLKPNNCC